MRTDPSPSRSCAAAPGGVLVAVMVIALGGCATRGDPPKAELATAESSVDRASSTPTIATAAPVEMQSARDKLARARRAMENKDYDEARRYAEQAEIDARLAESKVAATRSLQALREIQESIRDVNAEVDRRSGAPGPAGAGSPAPSPAGTPAPPPASAPVGAPIGTPVGTPVGTPAAPASQTPATPTAPPR